MSSESQSVQAVDQSKLLLLQSLDIERQAPKHHVHLSQYAVAGVMKSAGSQWVFDEYNEESLLTCSDSFDEENGQEAYRPF